MLLNNSRDMLLPLQSGMCAGDVMISHGFNEQACTLPCSNPGSSGSTLKKSATTAIVPMQTTPRMHPMMLLTSAPAPMAVPASSLPSSPPAPPPMYGVRATLVNESIWKEFDALGTEMIITKTGRRMFPHLRFRLTGLQPHRLYIILLELVLADNVRYKYGQEVCLDGGGNDKSGGWRAAGAADIQAAFSARAVFHPQSPALGSAWMEKDISFVHAKMTNNARAPSGNILLSSMHKYFPRVHIVETTDLSAIMHSPTAVFEFEHTSFTAVTAYQNQKIIDLKIKKNPFAKGFREDGKARHKRKLSQTGVSGGINDDSASVSPELLSPSSEPRVHLDDDAVSTSSSFTSAYGSGSGTSSPVTNYRSPTPTDSPGVDEAASQNNVPNNSNSPTEPGRHSNLGLLSIDNILSWPDPPPRKYCPPFIPTKPPYRTFPEETNVDAYMSVRSSTVPQSNWYPEHVSRYSILRNEESPSWMDTFGYSYHFASPKLPVLQLAPLDFSVR